MCLKLAGQFEIPAETIRVAQAAFPQGNGLMKLRDELGVVFSEAEFADLFPATLRPPAPCRGVVRAISAGRSGYSHFL